MSDFRGEQFPVGALYAAGGLIGISLLTVGAIRLGVLPAPETAPQARERIKAQVVVSHDFTFEDRQDGALVVGDPATGQPAMILEPGSNSGFIRGVMRGMMRERTLHQTSRAAPVTITQWSDGALTLEDKATGRILELGSFGHTNRASFAQLLVPYSGNALARTAPPAADGKGPA
ncbi:photosynthetic complex assembly protein PuhC [Sandarakinorhabdus sp.]|uniref:photosynthetic complex assembly protein PuhC n=1 Tax=Sandarakinorhabdus sp. TaxID=1916663 RepID=UPI00286E73D3|nr:photosynthetic complex assembly protein PuhC [Sandarakinorhabdus sp.]